MLETGHRPLRLLFVDGNTREQRANYVRDYGATPAEAYAAEITAIAPGIVSDICLPADEGANLPDGDGLESYDGIFLTGSALHIYDIEPAVTRQIELMRAIYASGTPCFGSCWGIQMGCVAAGGTVVANPNGREVGFARRIAPTEIGRGHPLLAGRPAAFDAPAIHLDTVALPPHGTTILASNSISQVQAAEIKHDGGTFWGVQYHPEFSLGLIASILGRMVPSLIAEGFRKDEAAARDWLEDLRTLDAEPGRQDLAWAHGLDREVLDATRRVTELRNFLDHRVRPCASERGRA
ncbi:MAG: type 1 glutamine amidotransferase [Bosea sp.]|uniref:type 1 glutamine amidotransferase n=1 Tax=unclassified Bosea (in: a-proteobacteria) TaxID=2653178 RepID=UPI00095C0C7F|nr:MULTISPECIES: type 1 glutamine amidotransferase [unclassified Bosea (in: a-proteobacteria)]MBN9442686.1 type 1 glutamine amidotransferase [Bosea sp. (in: a-proteobacteria)]MBN9455008.1 type 1 glutamine amidotransferase [Bosea sp. (in: a-proteobacteria)]OJV04677.1 MAG: glutamine amidotransferase [Bosea sp. 67-29]